MTKVKLWLGVFLLSLVADAVVASLFLGHDEQSGGLNWWHGLGQLVAHFGGGKAVLSILGAFVLLLVAWGIQLYHGDKTYAKDGLLALASLVTLVPVAVAVVVAVNLVPKDGWLLLGFVLAVLIVQTSVTAPLLKGWVKRSTDETTPEPAGAPAPSTT